MTIPNMAFTPSTGLRDSTYSPQHPTSEAAIRDQIQGVSDQLRDFINDTIIATILSVTNGSSGADNLGIPEIIAGSGTTVRDRADWLYSQLSSIALGAVPDGSITIAKLSFDPATQTELDTHSGTGASETVSAHVELATAAETTTGTDNTKAVHPAGLKVELDKKVPLSLLTAQGDIPYASGSGTWANLVKGLANQVLGMNSAATYPQWIASLQSLMTATGDMVYASSANTPAKLAKGVDGQILKTASGLPAWGTIFAQGNYTDTSTYITANGTFTVTIPIGFNAQRGRLIISKADGSLGAIIFFGTNTTDAFSIWNSNSFAFAGGQLTSYSGSSFSNCGGNNFVNVQNVVITGSNLIITFIVSSFSTGSYKYYYTLRWEAEG